MEQKKRNERRGHALNDPWKLGKPQEETSKTSRKKCGSCPDAGTRLSHLSESVMEHVWTKDVHGNHTGRPRNEVQKKRR